MHILLLHQAVADGDRTDDKDVLDQVAAVSSALIELGHTTATVPCDLDLAALERRVKSAAPDAVFNLVECLGGHGRLIHLVPSLLDAMGVPYTGASAEALFLTSSKLLAKDRLRERDVQSPAWVTREQLAKGARPEPGRWIVKSVWEHASLGLDDGSVVEASKVADTLAAREPTLGGLAFAERYIEGRELNVTMLDGPDGPQALPVAEICFNDFPDGKPKIVSYDAKWAPDSFDYRHTPVVPLAEDRPLADELSRLALLAWDAFELTGYARVDFRVDESGRPFVLEVNANPCVSPDAGFSVAVRRAGLTYPGAIERILAAIPRRRAALR